MTAAVAKPETVSTQPAPRPLMLYDGECGLCDRSLRYVLKHDTQGRFHFAPLQSELGRSEMQRLGLDPTRLDSVTLIDEAGRAHQFSDAVWRIGRELGGIRRSGAALLRAIPRPLRDWGYRLVARHRIRVFGKADAGRTCSLLPPDQRARVHL
jgi:predicted DCC family thiol-disulfide oxidoreductase YuxK